MYRAFRVDKLILQLLETTLGHVLVRDWDALPALRMIFTPLQELRERAERVAGELSSLKLELRESESAIGGGSTPDQTLPSWAIEIEAANASELEARLRAGNPPVVCRIQRDRIILDMRTVFEEEETALVGALLVAVR